MQLAQRGQLGLVAVDLPRAEVVEDQLLLADDGGRLLLGPAQLLALAPAELVRRQPAISGGVPIA